MDLTCRRCGREVRVSAEHFEVFEHMHYVCFHYEFEHGDVDVDEECGSAGCPSASPADGRDRVIQIASELALESESGAPWENPMTHQYLEAFAAWLTDCDGCYANQGRATPRNGWDVVADALRAATIYE